MLAILWRNETNQLKKNSQLANKWRKWKRKGREYIVSTLGNNFVKFKYAFKLMTLTCQNKHLKACKDSDLTVIIFLLKKRLMRNCCRQESLRLTSQSQLPSAVNWDCGVMSCCFYAISSAQIGIITQYYPETPQVRNVLHMKLAPPRKSMLVHRVQSPEHSDSFSVYLGQVCTVCVGRGTHSWPKDDRKYMRWTSLRCLILLSY